MIKRVKNIFNTSSKKIKSTEKELKAIRDLEEEMKKMSEDDFKKRIQKIKDELKPLVEKVPEDSLKSIKKVNRREKFPEYEKAIQDKLFEFLPEVYAMLNESYRRTVGYTYHDVQLQAGILLARGQMLVEQYTGEGKTMTFQLPLVLYSLVGRGAHLVTVNEYLTKVGAEYAGHFLGRLGLTVGVIAPGGDAYRYIANEEIGKFKSEEEVEKIKTQRINIDAMEGLNLILCSKREAYNCDVTYSTNNELGFDYLRDNMAWDLNRLVQRELYFCVIDEADSILIDEARTPLIISATPSDADTEKYTKFAKAVEDLSEGKDYEVDHKSRSVSLTEAGMRKVEEFLKVDNIWDDYSMAYHLENALKAKAIFIKNDQYIVRSGNVYIVDEFTGRVLEGRRYSEGLHQAIEAKEGVAIQQESKTFATITFQNFFRLYKVLCGGSGTIMTESEEFYKIYGLDAVEIPTNKPRIRKDHGDRIYKTQDAKFNAVVEEIKEMNEVGRPVLVGTTSVENSEILSKLLDRVGIQHEVLNAKFHEQESRIVTQAGRKGAVTVATNMAGRGTDIVIGGGVRGDKDYQEIAELGGLHVIGTERHDSRRIDNQLRGRTGRQGEPGSTRFYVSLEDKIMRVLGGEIIARLFRMIKVPDNMPIEMGLISRQIETAQKRVEGVNFDSRKNVVEYDDVMNQHREIFYFRRRNILQTADQALGKFIIDRQFVDTNQPEHKDRLTELGERINQNKEKLEGLAEVIVDDVIYEKTLKSIPDGKITDQEVKDLKEKLSELVPESLLVKAFDVPYSKFDETLKDILKNDSDPAATIEDKLLKAFELKADTYGDDYYSVVKMVSLESMDKRWVDHLETMKDVKDSISLQGYAQKDPLVEYKNVAFRMFKSFISKTNEEIVSKLMRMEKVDKSRQPQVVENLQTNQADVEDILTGDREVDLGSNVQSAVDAIEKSAKKTQARLQVNSQAQRGGTVVNRLKEFGRNDKVTVQYADGRKVTAKFKKVQGDIEVGNAVIVE